MTYQQARETVESILAEGRRQAALSRAANPQSIDSRLQEQSFLVGWLTAELSKALTNQNTESAVA